MTFRLPVRWIAALVAMLPLPALAQTDLPNSVRCVEKAMSIEDREMALVLMFVRYGNSGEDRVNWLRGMAVAERLLSEARDRCRTAHRWSLAKAGAARDYAFHALSAEAMGQLVEAEGKHRAAPIEAWFDRNRADLTRTAQRSAEQDEAFADFLAGQGWDRENESELRLARNYLGTLIKLEEDRRKFAKP